MVVHIVKGLFQRLSSQHIHKVAGDEAKECRRSSNKIKNRSSQKRSITKEQEYLLDRLGGMTVLGSIVQEFVHRVTQDPRLKSFFDGVDPRLLTAHQKEFFATAFTSFDMDACGAEIRRAHARLFSLGLCEDHVDIFWEKLEGTLRDRHFGDAIVAEVKTVVDPLRQIFVHAASDYAASQKVQESNK